MEFAEYIKSLREQRRLTLRDVEEKTGISNSYLSQMENGRRFPSPEYVGKLATAYGVPVDDLLQHTQKYKAYENITRDYEYRIDVEDVFRQIMEQDTDETWRTAFDEVPPQVKTRLVQYAVASGFAHIHVEPRLEIMIKHSHIPLYSSIEMPDESARKGILVNRETALKLVRKPMDNLFGITDEAAEAFFNKQNLKSVKVNGEVFFNMMDVLMLQGRFPQLSGAPQANTLMSEPPAKKFKARKKAARNTK